MPFPAFDDAEERAMLWAVDELQRLGQAVNPYGREEWRLPEVMDATVNAALAHGRLVYLLVERTSWTGARAGYVFDDQPVHPHFRAHLRELAVKMEAARQANLRAFHAYCRRTGYAPRGMEALKDTLGRTYGW